MIDENMNEKIKELSLDDIDGISGGIGHDAPPEFLETIPDENLRKAWALAFAVAQNFKTWNSFMTTIEVPGCGSCYMEQAGVVGISEEEFKEICRKMMLIVQLRMEYPTF